MVFQIPMDARPCPVARHRIQTLVQHRKESGSAFMLAISIAYPI